jgi:hypothetical protein
VHGHAQRMRNTSYHEPITCKRGSAKHSVKDDHAFLWKHAIFRHLHGRNPSTDQHEIFYDWLAGEVTRCSKNGSHRLAGGSPTNRWNITSENFLIIPYLTFFSCNRLQQQRLNRFARTMAQTTRFAVRKCLLGVVTIGNYILGSKPQKTPNFGTGMPNFKPNEYTRITLDR